jgi:hypothetical protein
VLRGTVVAIAAAVGLVAWLSERGSQNGAAGVALPEVRVVSPAGLAGAAALNGHPVYWAGPIPGTELGLSEGADGIVQVRYLAAGSAPGAAEENVLTVGSYPLPGPARALAAFGRRPKSKLLHAHDGKVVVTSAESPGSAYFASPDDSVQVEVYDPAPDRALDLVLSGRVRPVR